MDTFIRINLDSPYGFLRYDFTAQVTPDGFLLDIQETKNGVPDHRNVTMPTEEAKKLRDFLNAWIPA